MITVNNRQDFLKEVKKLLPNKNTCVELGVLFGDFSQIILDILEPELLVLIDPFLTNEKYYEGALKGTPTAYSTISDLINVQKRFYNERLQGKVKVLRDYSYDAAKYLPDGVYDFIYHDASHLKDDVQRDLNDWLPKLKDNGLMCLHDYIEFEGFGVIEAVDDFCRENNFTVIIFNEVGGDIALQKIK